MAKKMTDKNTKKEILDAYEALRQEGVSKVSASPVLIQERKQDEEKVNNSEKMSIEHIITRFAEDKIKFIDVFENFSNELLEKAKAFKDLKDATTLIKQELSDLYGIKETYQGLNALLELKEQKEKEIQEYKVMLEKKRSDEFLNHSAILDQAKTENVRKLESEKYQLGLDLRNFKDQQERTKADLKQELKVLEDQIEYYNSLESAIEELEKDVQSKVNTAVAIKTEKMKKEFETEQKIKDLEIKNSIDHKNSTIQNQLDRITELTAIITELKESNNKLQEDAQNIAKTAIESSKTPNNFTIKSDK